MKKYLLIVEKKVFYSVDTVHVKTAYSWLRYPSQLAAERLSKGWRQLLAWISQSADS